MREACVEKIFQSLRGEDGIANEPLKTRQRIATPSLEGGAMSRGARSLQQAKTFSALEGEFLEAVTAVLRR